VTTTHHINNRVPIPSTSRVPEDAAAASSSLSPAMTHPLVSSPFVSVKKAYTSLDNPLLLKVNLFGKKPEVPLLD